MVVYGDLEEVKRLLRSHESLVQGADATSQLEKTQQLVTSLIDKKTGRSFGVAPVDEARIVWAGASKYLLIDPPARSVTSIEYGGTWNGLDLISPTTLEETAYAFDPVDSDGLIWGIRLGLGEWGYADQWGQARAPIRITAQWADGSASLAIPDDIEWIANYLIAASYRRARTSAESVIGPDGFVTAVPDPWKDSTVKEVIDKYSLIKTVRLA